MIVGFDDIFGVFFKVFLISTCRILINQICEDIPHVLDTEVPGLAERPINIFLPRLLQVNISYSYTDFGTRL